MNADRVLRELTDLLNLMKELERSETHGRAGRRNSTWAITHLGMGSVNTGLAPLEPGEGLGFAELDRIVSRTVDGFETAQREELIPDGWSTRAAQHARSLASRLGVGADTGMTLRLLVDDEVRRIVDVTRRASQNLDKALSAKYTSIGSVIGRLDEINLHATPRAGVWPVRGGRVTVLFEHDQTDMMRSALGKRVEAFGRLRRNAAGQIIDLKIRGLEMLPDSTPPITDLTGLDPDLTDGMSPGDYLRELRAAP